MSTIPFSLPYLTGKEASYVQEALESGQWSGDGAFSKKCVGILEQLTGKRVFLTPSGTSALELSLMALDLRPGDEVLLPSYTFVSSANAAVQMGLVPVFIDIRPDTLNIDEALIEQAVSPKTRALMVVHYAGVAAEMDAIKSMAAKFNLAVIEDAAHGVNAFYKGKALGSLGDLGAFSFHQTKNYSSGEGGAIVVANEKYLERVEIHRQKGTDRSKFLMGAVDKYSWVDRGSNYLLSNLLSAVLYAQLENLEDINSKRKAVCEYYQAGLADLSDHLLVPSVPSSCRSNYHLFYFLLKDPASQTALLSFLKKAGIEATTHFVPLHDSPGGKRFGVTRGPMTITEKTAKGLVRLPLYPQLTQDSQKYILGRLKAFFSSHEIGVRS